ncbi:Phosphoenolpyruvate-protein phosphotransferase [Dermatophilus congolensis]|uniref:Phosphocarrier protein HPr n=1 Tax=Dermatophilus congolensis TaxID=1863 RepID=A0AA46BM44_9MICO|nr:phosphoenolpyruvate--protein phosphotransferase [Dermatophilus congolensis]STD06093.1 Phosphoenolpyruvate-protein phosphotransferase [Dermatophilus congolensis]
MTADRVVLMAPMTGAVVPLEEVPDPVFAKRMVGDGFSIYPMSSELCAPVDGEVIDLHPSKHAVTIRTGEGLEVLMHIGLETVRLDGEGFEALVETGQVVRVGEPLVRFDLAVVSEKATSTLTEVVITNGELVSGVEVVGGLVTVGEDAVARVTLVPGAQLSAQVESAFEGDFVVSEELIIPNPTGMHARPAATLVTLAKELGGESELRYAGKSANATSITSVLALGLTRGSAVQVAARGDNAQKTVERLAAAILSGLGDDIGPDAGSSAAVAASDSSVDSWSGPRSGDPNLLLGVAASTGLAIGHVRQLHVDIADFAEDASDPAEELRVLDAAIERAREQIVALSERVASDDEKAAIFAAHSEIIADPELRTGAVAQINAGRSAPFAWQQSFMAQAAQLAALRDEVLSGRATDIRDVGRRVLAELTGNSGEVMEFEEGTILVAEELTPSDTAALDRSKVVGFATTAGGASSHVAIIARSMGIPAVAGIERAALEVPDGTRVILDGAAGTLRMGADDAEIARIEERQAALAAKHEADLSHAHESAVTTDGYSIEVVANIGNVEDACSAMKYGAEGVGLLRSEFIFLGRSSAPSEDEQTSIYREISRSLHPGQPLVIRTLDVGGDKPLPYLPIEREENPFLGVRGVRVGLERPEVLRTQARAILRAADGGTNLQVMFPMIATLEEFRAAKAIFDAEAVSLGVARVPLGIMVEVPSVAVMASQFAKEVDFFSVGTNDLTSYTLAMDRGHPKLASQVDPCNPAVLQLIGRAAKAAHSEGKWLGVCGGIASDPQAVPFLIGLGVDELSCSIPAIPEIKAAVRAVSFEDCRVLADKALEAGTATEVRALNPLDGQSTSA